MSDTRPNADGRDMSRVGLDELLSYVNHSLAAGVPLSKISRKRLLIAGWKETEDRKSLALVRSVIGRRLEDLFREAEQASLPSFLRNDYDGPQNNFIFCAGMTVPPILKQHVKRARGRPKKKRS